MLEKISTQIGGKSWLMEGVAGGEYRGWTGGCCTIYFVQPRLTCLLDKEEAAQSRGMGTLERVGSEA